MHHHTRYGRSDLAKVYTSVSYQGKATLQDQPVWFVCSLAGPARAAWWSRRECPSNLCRSCRNTTLLRCKAPPVTGSQNWNQHCYASPCAEVWRSASERSDGKCVYKLQLLFGGGGGVRIGWGFKGNIFPQTASKSSFKILLETCTLHNFKWSMIKILLKSVCKRINHFGLNMRTAINRASFLYLEFRAGHLQRLDANRKFTVFTVKLWVDFQQFQIRTNSPLEKKKKTPHKSNIWFVTKFISEQTDYECETIKHAIPPNQETENKLVQEWSSGSHIYFDFYFSTWSMSPWYFMLCLDSFILFVKFFNSFKFLVLKATKCSNVNSDRK